MVILTLIAGLFLLFLGLGYLYMPQLILRFNALCRDTFFKDSIVLLSNRRVGIILLLLSFVLIMFTLHPRYK